MFSGYPRDGFKLQVRTALPPQDLLFHRSDLPGNRSLLPLKGSVGCLNVGRFQGSGKHKDLDNMEISAAQESSQYHAEDFCRAGVLCLKPEDNSGGWVYWCPTCCKDVGTQRKNQSFQGILI